MPDSVHRAARHGRSVLLALVAVTAAGLAALPVRAAPQSTFTGVERVVAFADVHGAYAELTALLQSVGVIDAQGRWIGGRRHVVSVGDLLDRGADSRKVMDLLMRLQREAEAAGGRVHVVLGNHEAMNVLGDLRYVDAGEYAAYADEENADERRERLAGFLARSPGATEADFARLFPPGYFGHRRLLGPQGSYGRWLLGLPVAIRIDDTVYMHAGPSRQLAGRNLEQLNAEYAAALAEYVAAEAALVGAGLLQFEDRYDRRTEAARQRLEALPPDAAREALAAAVERFRRADDEPLLGAAGPNWYRGAALCNECAEADVIEPFLAQAGARRVVVGHTVARDSTVVSRFDGALVKLDAGMNRAVYGGRPAALISDASGTRVAYALPDVPPAAVPAEPLYLSSQKFDEETVAAILAGGAIEITVTCAPGVHETRVTLDGRSVNAVFEAASPEVVRRELAAWRLDRLLGLGLVPATVARSHAGQDGVLQARPVAWASEQDRQNLRGGIAAGLACQTITAVPQAEPARRPRPADGTAPKLPTGGACDIGAQYRLAYAFDALIGNRARTPERYLYDADEGTLLLTGHGDAFGTATQLPAVLEPELARIGPELQDRLKRLDAAQVEQAIGKLVGVRAVKPLLQRRDRILVLAAAGGKPGG